MCVFSLVKVGRIMIESLRLIGKIEMPKAKAAAARNIKDDDKAEAMRLLAIGAKVAEIANKTGINKSSVLRYQSEMKQAAISKERY